MDLSFFFDWSFYDWLNIVFILILIVFSAFFSGSETALTAVSRVRMHKLEKEGNKQAKLVNQLLNQREKLIGTILLGNNLVNILSSVLATTIFLSFFSQSGIVYATLVMTVLIVVFAEITPKTMALSDPDRTAMLIAGPIALFVKLFSPITSFLVQIVRLTLKLFGVRTVNPILTPIDEIRGAVDWHHKEGGVIKDDKDMIGGILDLKDLTIDDVMIHRKNIVMIDANQKPEAILETVFSQPHTRFPLWKDNADNIIGILHSKDLLRAIKLSKGEFNSIDITTILREPWFVPEKTPLISQLKAFQKKREHFALIVDEYGVLMGIVTLEDILEEIVGDIRDEHDSHVEGVKLQQDKSVITDGIVTIRDLNRAMDWDLPDEQAVTIAGLVIHEAKTIPEPGQKFSFHGFRFQILKRHRNQITELKISKLPKQEIHS